MTRAADSQLCPAPKAPTYQSSAFSPALFAGEKVAKPDEGGLQWARTAANARQFVSMLVGLLPVHGSFPTPPHPPSAPSPPLKSVGEKALDVWSALEVVERFSLGKNPPAVAEN